MLILHQIAHFKKKKKYLFTEGVST